MRIGHVKGVILSGAIWLIVGVLLTFKGLFITVHAMTLFKEGNYPILAFFNLFFEQIEKSGMAFVLAAAVLGLIKGRLVLAKTVRKMIKRILLIPSPLSLKDLFPWRYLLLIGLMMSLGLLLKFLPIPSDIRAFVNVAVGAALINGAFFHFKQTSMLKLQFLRNKK